MRHRTWAALAVAGVALLLTACTSAQAGGPSTSTSSASTSAASPTGTAEPSTTATSDAASEVVTTAPPTAASTDRPANAAALDFTARRLAGGTIDGEQLAGGDVVLWMWAPWCPQCNREAPHVAEAVERFGDRVTFVGVAGHDTDEAHRGFVEEHGLDEVLTIVDDDGSLWARYDVSYQPAWVFVNQDGTVTRVAGGLYDDLTARLQALVDG